MSQTDGDLPQEEEDHVLPSSTPLSTRQRFALNWSEMDTEPIREYVETSTDGEYVSFLQRLSTERAYGQDHEVWDVLTDQARYWVITAPTNLYLQDDFPSVDFLLSFHIGLTARIFARSDPPVNGEEHERFAVAWRRWSQAADALERADEAEEFQAVGMRCRECLLEFIAAISDAQTTPREVPPPKHGDFVHWSELVAQTIARGKSAAVVRKYLKVTAKEAWQYVNWLTHAKNATRPDGRLALDATQHLLLTFGSAYLRHKRGIPDRCGKCSSTRLVRSFRPDLDEDDPYVTVCQSCGSVRLGHGDPS